MSALLLLLLSMQKLEGHYYCCCYGLKSDTGDGWQQGGEVWRGSLEDDDDGHGEE